MAHIGPPYNAILGYPALAKFIEATHHGYNILKMPRCSGIITIACDEKHAVCSLEHTYWAATTENSDGKGDVVPPEASLAKKLQLLPENLPKAKKQPARDNTQGSAPSAG